MKKQKYICEDSDGNIFLSFDKLAEDKIDQMSELTHCLAVVKVGDEYLLGWNKWRNRFEIFGGCIKKMRLQEIALSGSLVRSSA